jgi:transposase
MTDLKFNEEELDKIYILRQVSEKIISQVEAAEKIGISVRQVRRIQKKLKEEGAWGIKPKAKGGNRKFKEEFKTKVMAIVSKEYPDFGPTFAAEKVKEQHQIAISKETLRQWMVEAGLWHSRKRKAARIHQTRTRRAHLGELVQIDGSHHDWFEGRGEKSCLYVFIDDATSRLLSMRFELTETTTGYFRCVDTHLKSHGRPLAYYSDRHSIFKTTRPGAVETLGPTQFYRALRELNIELICAHSPQAKGRVERANKTLQDRLVKEMRLRNISTIEDANAYLPSFIEAHNKKFALPAAKPEDAHRPFNIDPSALDRIFSFQEERKLSKNLECRYKGKIFQIQSVGGGYHLQHASVTICELMNGRIEILRKNVPLAFKQHISSIKEPLMGERKDLDALLKTVNVSLLLCKTG